VANVTYKVDCKDEDGNWLKFVGNSKDRFYTKSGKLWYAIESRGDVKGGYQRRNGTYIGAENKFANFNAFAEWCQDQIGYSHDTVFQLDKDLLVKGNKLYSEDTCVFVPKEINQFVIGSTSAVGAYPRGVNLFKRTGRFRAECYPSGCGLKRHLGYFDHSEEAFLVYKDRREYVAKFLANKWQGKIEQRAVDALNNFEVDIFD